MMPRLFLTWLLSLACALAATSQPNIVYIISDDHAWTDYGFMGHPQIETPHLDKLAARSAVFPRGYVPTALCRPALATFATGLYAHQSLISGNDPARPAGGAKGKAKAASPAYNALRSQMIDIFYRETPIVKRLADLGYLSYQSGKWWEGDPKRAGFTECMTKGFPNPNGRHGDAGLKIGREGMQPVLDFVDSAVKLEKPFFLWYAPMMPHSPHTPPDALFQKYKAKGITSDHVARYYAMVEWFDQTCGQLMDHLNAKGLTHNTLILYLADNGWIQDPESPGYAPKSKQSANEGGTRQPIMFSWPGVIQPGKRGDQLCSSIDMVPTALAAAGAAIPEHLPGLNLLPALKSGAATTRTEVHGETFAHDVANLERPEDSLVFRWVIDGKWKLLLSYDNALEGKATQHETQGPQLFDLLADPHENSNLAQQNPEKVKLLSDKLQAWWAVTQRRALQ
jgi:arylsulfatase A-like enzyme